MVETPVAIDDLGPAQWLVAGIPSFAYDVSSLLPAHFGAYARVFHPPYRGTEKLSWAQIALANDTVAHPQMQFTRLLGYASRHERGYQQAQSVVFDTAPAVGRLPVVTSAALTPTLGRHTAASDTCWFAFWDGWAALLADIRKHPTFQLPNRAYHLAFGTITAATTSASAVSGEHVPANLWWPDDHAWCVATDIDLDSTYIGGSESCIDELLSNPDLEAARVSVATGIAADSDTLNPVEPT
jgi:hypothetical protein